MSIETQLFDNVEVDDFDIDYIAGYGKLKTYLGRHKAGDRVRFNIMFDKSIIELWPQGDPMTGHGDKFHLVLSAEPNQINK